MYVRLDLGRHTVDCWASAAVLACCLARKEAGRRCENLAAPSLRMWVPVLLVGPLRLELYGEGRPDARAPCRVRAWLQSAWLGLGLGLGLANPNPNPSPSPNHNHNHDQVHGRVRGHWSHRRKGPADLLQIKAVKEAVRCPVLTNGNVSSPG